MIDARDKTLEQKVKASMASSLHFIDQYIIIQSSEPHVYSQTDSFTLSGFTSAFKAALNERKQHGTSSCLYNHDGFNALT